jgi:FixJ family two-component response regulator
MKPPERETQPIVFVIDDDESLRDALKRLFRMVGLRAETFPTAADFMKRKLPEFPPASCLISDCLESAGSSFRLNWPTPISRFQLSS